jgi:transcriptional regulator GlxA family with amidase domain
MDRRLKRIGILLFEGCDLLDFAGPTTAFFSAARHLVRTGQADSLL